MDTTIKGKTIIKKKVSIKKFLALLIDFKLIYIS